MTKDLKVPTAAMDVLVTPGLPISQHICCCSLGRRTCDSGATCTKATVHVTSKHCHFIWLAEQTAHVLSKAWSSMNADQPVGNTASQGASCVLLDDWQCPILPYVTYVHIAEDLQVP